MFARSPATLFSRLSPHSCRRYSSGPQKASVKLVAELRKLTETSIVKAREALSVTNNDLTAALEWLERDLVESGAKKAAKVASRSANEGLIAVSLLSRGIGEDTGAIRAAMVEVNCETDFVGRSQLFGTLVSDIAHSAAFISEQPQDLQQIPIVLRPCSVDKMMDAPLISQSHLTASPSTIGSAIRDTIAKVGENIQLRRAVVAVLERSSSSSASSGIRAASYLHGGGNVPGSGRLGALALLRLHFPQLQDSFTSGTFRGDLEKLERSIARQIVGFETRTISAASTGENADTSLYKQPFMMYPTNASGDSVRQVLDKWAQEKSTAAGGITSIDVTEFAKWTVGESWDPEESLVVSEVLAKLKYT